MREFGIVRATEILPKAAASQGEKKAKFERTMKPFEKSKPRELRSRFSGEVLLPGDVNYDEIMEETMKNFT